MGQKPGGQDLLFGKAESAMSMQEFFEPAVDAAFHMVGGSWHSRVSDKRKQMRQAVLHQAAYGPQLSVGIPPPALSVCGGHAGTFRQEPAVFSIPMFPGPDPTAFLSSCADLRQAGHQVAQVSAGSGLRAAGQLGVCLSNDVNQASLNGHRRPTPLERGDHASLAVTDDSSRRWQPRTKSVPCGPTLTLRKRPVHHMPRGFANQGHLAAGFDRHGIQNERRPRKGRRRLWDGDACPKWRKPSLQRLGADAVLSGNLAKRCVATEPAHEEVLSVSLRGGGAGSSLALLTTPAQPSLGASGRPSSSAHRPLTLPAMRFSC